MSEQGAQQRGDGEQWQADGLDRRATSVNDGYVECGKSMDESPDLVRHSMVRKVTRDR